MEARDAFADTHRNWRVWHWRRVIFTDESPFRLINPSGRIFVRRMEEEELEPFAIQASVPFNTNQGTRLSIANGSPHHHHAA